MTAGKTEKCAGIFPGVKGQCPLRGPAAQAGRRRRNLPGGGKLSINLRRMHEDCSKSGNIPSIAGNYALHEFDQLPDDGHCLHAEQKMGLA